MSRRKQARPRSFKVSGGEEGEEEKEEVAAVVAEINDMDQGQSKTKTCVPEPSEEAGLPQKDVFDDDDIVVDENENYHCKMCTRVFDSLTRFMLHQNFDCITDSANTGESNNIQDTSLAASYSATEASHESGSSPLSVSSLYDNNALPSPVLLDTEPLSPALDCLTPETVPYNAGVSETHPYACQFCDKAFSRLSHLKRHEHVHSDQLPFVCKVCDKRFKHKRSRDRHVNLHTGQKKYCCNLCEAKFARSDHLKIHLKTHEGSKPYQCCICNRTYMAIASLVTHTSVHKKLLLDRKLKMVPVFKCAKCKKTFDSGGELEEHVAQVHENNEEQVETDVVIPATENYGNGEIDQSDSSTFFSLKSASDETTIPTDSDSIKPVEHKKCPICLALFPSADDVLEHMKSHQMMQMTGSMESSNSQTMNQGYHGNNVQQMEHGDVLDNHSDTSLKQDTQKIVCPYCNLDNFKTLEFLEIHMQSVHSVKQTELYTCNHCNAPYPNLYTLHEHMRIVHKNQPCFDIQYPCNICSAEFPTMETLGLHKAKHHSNDLLPALLLDHTKSATLPGNHFQCHQCPKSYSNIYDFQKHFSSVHCNPGTGHSTQTLNNNNNPYYHSVNKVMNTIQPVSVRPTYISTELAHTTTNYVAKSNSNTLKSPPTTLSHKSPEISKKMEMLKCEECSIIFPDRKSYDSHQKIHVKIKMEPSSRPVSAESHRNSSQSASQLSTPHICAYCGQNMPSEEALDSHVFSHFLIQIVDYGCVPCMKMFSKPDYLQKHLMDIHAHHLYKCSLCKEIFDSKVNIQVHFAIAHSNECKMYQCAECQAVFRTEMEWQLHVKVTHLKITRPFRCLFCKESFVTELELQCHLTTHQKTFRCTMCDEAFHVEFLLDKHIEEIHNPRIPVLGGVSELHKVNVKIEKEQMINDCFTSHINNNNSTSRADVNDHSPPKKSPQQKISWHTTLSIGSHVCDICDMRFIEHTSLWMHKAQYHGSTPGSSVPESPDIKPSLKRIHSSTLTGISNSHGLNIATAASAAAAAVVAAAAATTATISSPSPTKLLPPSTPPINPVSPVLKQINGEKFLQSCNFCSQSFKSKIEMEKHMKIHVNSGGLKCSICDKTFTSAESLAKHKLQHCKIPQGNNCVGCRKELVTEEEFYSHAQEHGCQGTLMQCVICRQTLGSMGELQMHGKHHFQTKPLIFMCYVCLKTFDSKENLISQVNANTGQSCFVCKPCYHGELPVSCGMCNKGFMSDEELEIHVSSEHSKNTFQCIKCQESFGSEYEIQIHVAKHMLQEGNIHNCKICLKNFDSPAKLQCHLIDHSFEGTDIKCYVCNQSFQTNFEIQSHVIDHGPSVRRYSCGQCLQTFFFSSELDNHLYSHSMLHPTNTSPRHSTSKYPPGTVANSTYHQIISPSTSNCRSGRVTSPPQALPIKDVAGVPMVLTSVKLSHICSLCGQTFESVDMLQQHMLTAHFACDAESEKPVYSCSDCNKIYTQLTEFQAHLKTHDAVLSRNMIQCRICNKMFASSKTLSSHMKTHSGVKPYECAICKKRFTRKENRKAHMRTHSDVKPFTCVMCAKTFSRKAHMRDHVRVHFAQNPTNPLLLECIRDTDNLSSGTPSPTGIEEDLEMNDDGSSDGDGDGEMTSLNDEVGNALANNSVNNKGHSDAIE